TLQLAGGVLMFDAAGHLLINNHNAQELYRNLGYRDNIIGMSYDNLCIDYRTFEYVLYQMKYKMSNEPIESNTTYLNYYF
ncbi:sensor histidine kinase, partial [Enterococcus faecalis]